MSCDLPGSCEFPCYEVGQLVPQLAEPEPHPSLDRADRLVEQLGYLTVAEPAEVRPLDGAALFGRKRVERAAHAASLLSAGGLHVRPLGCLVALLHDVQLLAPALVGGAAAERVDGAVVDDAQDPGPHAPARRVVAH